MKKLFAAVLLGTLVSAPSFAIDTINPAQVFEAVRASSQVLALDLIKWKVGESEEYKVGLGTLPLGGTMKMAVSKEEGNAIWLVQDMNLLIQKDHSEMLMSRVDGKILKFVHNGKEEAIPDNAVEIIDQDYTDVTVPAGTFKAMHITAKTKQVEKLELWANPTATCMDGMLKTVVPQNGMEITIELTKFTKL